MSKTQEKQILTRLYNADARLKETRRDKSFNLVLNRKKTERFFRKQKNVLTRRQFDGSVMRAVRKLHQKGLLDRIDRGNYIINKIGMKYASKAM